MLEIKEQSLTGIKFIDLFAGIGGFHYALKSFGAECVFTSEWEEHASTNYLLNHHAQPTGDITKISECAIPPHDMLCAGFPCQAFSVSGKQKGFEDARGSLFFDILRIAQFHQPKVLFLENVAHLLHHQNGETFEFILSTLKKINYNIHYKILNTGDFKLPQHRKRLYIVAIRKDIDDSNFTIPQGNSQCVALNSLLEKRHKPLPSITRNDILIYKNYHPEISLDGKEILPNRPIQIGKVNKGCQGERIYHPLGHAITLSAYGGGVGAKTGLYLIGGKVRKLSPRECARLQGFPEYHILPSSSNQAYKQFGNSVSINVLQHILFNIAKLSLRKI